MLGLGLDKLTGKDLGCWKRKDNMKQAAVIMLLDTPASALLRIVASVLSSCN